jgi:hypothetical protein
MQIAKSTWEIPVFPNPAFHALQEKERKDIPTFHCFKVVYPRPLTLH